MTQEQIVEGNKLIAEFMSDFILLTKDEAIVVRDRKTLCFHSSWDWLMPVIDKIRSMNEYSGFVDHTSSIVDEGGVYINTKFIENTWKDVVEFIKWYNVNK